MATIIKNNEPIKCTGKCDDTYDAKEDFFKLRARIITEETNNETTNKENKTKETKS